MDYRIAEDLDTRVVLKFEDDITLFIPKDKYTTERYIDIVDYILDMFVKESLNELLGYDIFYWCWKLQLVKKEQGYYEILSYSHVEKGKLVRGLDNPIRLFDFQKEFAESRNLEFCPIDLGDHILISDQMLQEINLDELFCWRFEPNEGYCGWVLSEFDYKVDSVKKIHLYNCWDEILEVLTFMAIPAGNEIFREQGLWFVRENPSLIN